MSRNCVDFPTGVPFTSSMLTFFRIALKHFNKITILKARLNTKNVRGRRQNCTLSCPCSEST